MFVYRIETLEGKGFFAAGHAYTYYESVNFKHCPSDLPCPISEEEAGTKLAAYANSYRSNAYFDSNMIFGCSSKRQLRQWVKYAKGRRTLRYHGIRFVKYKVEKQHIIRGHFQVVFNKDYAEKICELDPTTLKEVA